MFLDGLQSWVAQNRPALEAVGVTVSLSDPTPWEKSGQGVLLSRPDREGQVLVWDSGECEVALGDVARPDPDQRHHDLTSNEELWEILDRFRDEFLAQPG
jgi:hypothetical protein